MQHLVILRQPFFDMILDGTKTIESRFSFNKAAPYGKIKNGDVLFLKQTGKDVTASAVAAEVKFFELTPQIVEYIRKNYGNAIGTDKFADWQTTLTKKYCSLIWLKNVKQIDPIKVPRSNGAGWIILK